MTKTLLGCKVYSIFFIVLSSALVACGGGGSDTRLGQGSGSSSGTSTSASIGIPLIESPLDDSSWQEGIFNSSLQFKSKCESPRTEINQTTQELIYPDTLGSLLDEKNWIRSWNNEHYLWYEEVVDRNPSLFDGSSEYFSELKTFETTASGKDKDRFHFTLKTNDFIEESLSGISIGYGFTLVVTSDEVPREFVIAYTQPNSPATSELINLKRGAKILSVDGIDIVNTPIEDTSLDDAYSGLFPSQLGETHTFSIKDPNSESIREVELNSVQVTIQPVQNTKIINSAEGKVGYILFNEHIETAETQLIETFTNFKNENISDLILDLRYNGGGLVNIANTLSSMISSIDKTENLIFNKQTFNDKHPLINPFTGDDLTGTKFNQKSSTGESLPHLNLSRVFILTGEGTCSASELIINGLQGINVDVIQIGSTTCGKPFGFYPTDNCGTTFFSINFRSENNTGFGDYDDGFSPVDSNSNIGALLSGCSVPDDFMSELGNINEERLASAIYYINNGECPVSSRRPLKYNKINEIPIKPSWLNNAVITNKKN